MTKQGLALVLSGGGARGIAHLGVLQALDEEGIRIDAISGVSAGAIAAAFYSNGYSPRQILELIKETTVIRTFRPTTSPGLLKLDKAENLFRKYLKKDTFEKIDIPISFSAVNVENAEVVYFSQGDIIAPLLASISFPPFFRPMKYDGKLFADGGLVNNLPVEPVKDYELVMGVNINVIKPTPNSFIQYAEWVATVVVTNNIQSSKSLCDIFLEPPAMRNFSVSDVKKAEEIFKVGYNYTIENMDKITDKIKKLKSSL